MQYHQGELVRVHAVFTDTDDIPIDPSSVFLTIRSPTGVTTTYTYLTDAIIVKNSVGDYHADISGGVPGRYYFRWYSTGFGEAAAEDFFIVKDAITIT